MDHPLEHRGAARPEGEETNNEGQHEQQFLFGAEAERQGSTESDGNASDDRDGQRDASQCRPKGQIHAGLETIGARRPVRGQPFGEKDQSRDYDAHHASGRATRRNPPLHRWRECLRQQDDQDYREKELPRADQRDPVRRGQGVFFFAASSHGKEKVTVADGLHKQERAI